MQPQGLQALMPQMQQRQAPAAQPAVDPVRLNAATDLVSSDAEEQVLDPKLLAMMKYNDAIQAIQAADQALAAQYQPPQPANMFERKQMAAAEGIAGLTKKLAPGIQQRGQQMAMSGGLPQLPAPNMAGMARMARGGIVGYAGPEGSEVRGYPVGATYVDPGTGEVLPVAERISKALYDVGTPVRGMLSLLSKPATIRRLKEQYPEATSAELEAMYESAQRKQGYTYPSQRQQTETVESEPAPVPTPTPTPVPTSTTTGTPLDPTRIPSRTAAANVRNSGILEGLLSRAAPTAAAGSTGTMGRTSEQLNKLFELINAPPETTTPQIDSRLEALREPMIDAVTRFMDPDYAENQRSKIQQEAAAAYAMPQEYKDLINARVAALDKPLYTPEEARSRKIDALLAGLASSNLIAQSGPRAAAMVNQVSDAIKQDSLNRADKQFTLSSGLMEKDMGAAKEAFNAGIEAMNAAQNQITVAVQMGGSMLANADQRAAANALQARQEQLAQLTSSIQLLTAIGTLERADLDRLVEVQRGAVTGLNSIQNDIADLTSNLSIAATPEAKAAIEAGIGVLRLQADAYRNVINAVNTKLGFPTQPSPDSGDQSGRGSGLPEGFVED